MAQALYQRSEPCDAVHGLVVGYEVRLPPDDIRRFAQFLRREKVRIAVDVTFESGVEVRMPVFEDALGPFAIRAVEAPPDTPDETGAGTSRRWVRTWTVDTFVSGAAEVPAITVPFIGEVGRFGWSVAHEERVDDYRSIP